jgi:hypothetical protein
MESVETSSVSPLQRLAVVCSVDDLRSDGFVLRRDLDKSERMRRALRIFGICFGIAFLTIFIPILHFILPPLFLVIGGVFATTTYMDSAEIASGEIVCPNCKKQMEVRKQPEEWPKAVRCEGCSYSLSLNPASV